MCKCCCVLCAVATSTCHPASCSSCCLFHLRNPPCCFHQLQEFMQYPALDTKNNTLLPNYAIETYEAAMVPILKHLEKLQGSMGSSILKIDAGFKV